MFESTNQSLRDRLEAARLYLVVDAGARGGATLGWLPEALAAGVDIVQLRDKTLEDEPLVAIGRRFRTACDHSGALLVLNDRPDLVVATGADGVHLGQDDGELEAARTLLGGDRLIGVSTHSAAQIEAAEASTADYLGVGPVYETPTKPGRPAVGLELVTHAATHARKPWFAIGGIDVRNAAAVIAAGARRIAVVRAIRDTADPADAAAKLARTLGARVGAAI